MQLTLKNKKDIILEALEKMEFPQDHPFLIEYYKKIAKASKEDIITFFLSLEEKED